MNTTNIIKKCNIFIVLFCASSLLSSDQAATAKPRSELETKENAAKELEKQLFEVLIKKPFVESEAVPIIENLLNQGANSNAIDPWIAWPPLMWAANIGSHSLAQLFINKGADVNFRHISDTYHSWGYRVIEEQTPLMLACWKSKDLAALLILNGADLKHFWEHIQKIKFYSNNEKVNMLKPIASLEQLLKKKLFDEIDDSTNKILPADLLMLTLEYAQKPLDPIISDIKQYLAERIPLPDSDE